MCRSPSNVTQMNQNAWNRYINESSSYGHTEIRRFRRLDTAGHSGATPSTQYVGDDATLEFVPELWADRVLRLACPSNQQCLQVRGLCGVVSRNQGSGSYSAAAVILSM